MVSRIMDMRDTRSMPINSCIFTALSIWMHLLRLRMGTKFRITTPDNHSRISFTQLTRIKITFASTLESGAQKYEPRLRSLSIPREQRPKRNVSRTKDINDNIAPIATEATTLTHVRRRGSVPSSDERLVSVEKHQR